MPPGTDPHAPNVYAMAASRFAALKRDAPLVREEPRRSICIVFEWVPTNRLARQVAMPSTSTIGTSSGSTNARDATRKMIERVTWSRFARRQVRCFSRIGHRRMSMPWLEMSCVRIRCSISSAADDVQHTVWRVPSADERTLVAAFHRVPVLYIADGHHRAASAARARQTLRQQEQPTSAGAVATAVAAQVRPFDSFLGVAFPDSAGAHSFL